MSGVGSFPCKPFTPRPAHAHALIDLDAWTLKPYAILGRDSAADLFDAHLLATIAAALPTPARTASRPGVAFAIHHIATPLDYLIVCWWDNENELFTRVLVRDAAAADRDPATPWRATDRESFCVWDMDIMQHERAAYVRQVLSGNGDVAGYVADRTTKPTAG
ncbi:MAG: hypothetical protein K2Y21_07385 [Phycisphaerales bacterium]|nr:hypothetical protein [Phycisphaerales bacterium]